MLKKLILAVMPLTLVASANAEDDLAIDLSSISDADIAIVESGLDIDISELTTGDSNESESDAIEACFRRFRYNCRSWGYGGHYGHCYQHCYNYCRPLYSYKTITYCPPVYRCIAAPVYTYYWGCH